MSKPIGIRQHTIQKIISGARVAFDVRGTKEADETRDPNNYRTLEKPLRKMRWLAREADKRAARSASEAA